MSLIDFIQDHELIIRQEQVNINLKGAVAIGLDATPKGKKMFYEVITALLGGAGLLILAVLFIALCAGLNPV